MSVPAKTLPVEKSVHGSLAEEIARYWDNRAESYSNGVVGELGNDCRTMWKRALDVLSREQRDKAATEGRILRVADVGCGPGFFSTLFAELGYEVHAIDGSEEMLARACSNVLSEVPDAKVAFQQSDFAHLPYPDGTFDLLATRNVTWLMREPEATYAEWLRVLRPGGKLVVFDSNWYLYLYDSAIDEIRHAGQDGNVLEGWDEDAQATSDEEKHCEEIARKLPLSPVVRPAWDIEALSRLGAAQVVVDKNAWKSLWTKSEQMYYAYAPMFMIEATK